jgi:hypothetical protein
MTGALLCDRRIGETKSHEPQSTHRMQRTLFSAITAFSVLKLWNFIASPAA